MQEVVHTLVAKLVLTRALPGLLLLISTAHPGFAQSASGPTKPVERPLCMVRSFGAVGDGHHLDTSAIQAAIRACASKGGGIVRFTPGTYLSGSIQLLSNITLDLAKDARLLGSPDVRDYVSVGRSSEERSTALIWAIGAHNVGISGEGIIDGNGRAFVAAGVHNTGGYDPKSTRQGATIFARYSLNRDGPVEMLPRPGVLVLLIECDAVQIAGIQVRDAPNWCIHLACCRHVRVVGIDVRNSLLIPNADALDVSSSQDVLIDNVYLEAGDDGIAISPCADGYCQQVARDIHITNAVIVSRSAGIRLGWAAHDIRDVSFDHVVIRNSNRGIGIFVRGNEHIENISFTNISIDSQLVDGDWWGMGEPIHVSVLPWRLTGAQGVVSGLRFDHVTTSADSPILLYADKPGQIKDVVFNRLQVHVHTSPLIASYGGNLDLRPAEPVTRGISSHDVAAVEVFKLSQVEFHDTIVSWDSSVPKFFRAGLSVTNFKNLVVDGFSGSGPTTDTPAILLVQGDQATLKGARASQGKLLVQQHVRHLSIIPESGAEPPKRTLQ